MNTDFKAVIFDLGGVLLKWDSQSVSTISPKQFVTIMNSTEWHDLDRGELTVKQACQSFGTMLDMDPVAVEASLNEAQKSLEVVQCMVDTIHDLEKVNPKLKFFVMSNVCKEHFGIVFKALDIPWTKFTQIFVSGDVGMRKPDLCFWRHVITEIGVKPEQAIMADDLVENICAARSMGINGLLVDNKHPEKAAAALYNLLDDPLARAQSYLRSNAGEHHSTVEKQGELIKFEDNFSQLMIWELTGDEDIIYLRWPSGAVQRGKQFPIDKPINGDRSPITNGHTEPEDIQSNANFGLWNYFFRECDIKALQFPADADTTSTAYISLPAAHLSRVADVNLVLDELISNVDENGIAQTYFDEKRPRTVPDVCCNVLRAFYHFGRGSDPRLDATKDWVVNCLNNRAYLNGSRHYSIAESFLYFVARLKQECGADPLGERLASVQEKLEERLNKPGNPLAVAFRLFACQVSNSDPSLYQKDLKAFLSLQQLDGGWPAGHFCCYGRTRDAIGSRGLTTALAVRIIQHEKNHGRNARVDAY